MGPGNELGEPIGIIEVPEHVGGSCLLNDWSAGDIQAWEYQPLGPFLSKNFASTVSTWIVTPEALAPFRIAQPSRPEADPLPLSYLTNEAGQRESALDLELEILVLTHSLREKGMSPHRLVLSNARHMYWTVAQMITHHTSNGCNLQTGDLPGTVTTSWPDQTSWGRILEATLGGKSPVNLASEEERHFLEDGDEVILRARGRRDSFAPVSFGECLAMILPAV
ncbi:fumarylacetoacetate hydrolase family protein [Microvirga terrestris]|uniref:fumarylacetoacetate hydrolase family protein n=1 Tax=Microvirga terrestris TaxID=2791024 RepID=UPI0031B9B650